VTAPKVAFVFPAGGSSGAAQVGSVRALLEAGIVPDAVVGASVGALNAAFLGLSPTAAQACRLADVWGSVTRADVYGDRLHKTLTKLALRHDHIYTGLPLRGLIARFCPLDDLVRTAVPVHIVTTDLDLGVARWWSTGPAQELLYASACLPGLFPPAVLEGHRHVDGGVLEPVPVQRAVDLDAATVYLLGDVSAPLDETLGRMSALDVLLRSFAISRYARLPEPERVARPGQRVVVVPGVSTRGIDIRDFTHTRRLIDESYRSTLRQLAVDEQLRAPAA
jgi:NTE family protein